MFKKIGISALLIASVSAACWSESQGYSCCSSSSVEVKFEDDSGKWGVENGDWCGIPEEVKQDCWAEAQGYSCCPSGTAVSYSDNSGEWGVVNGEWCGIIQDKPEPDTCWSKSFGFPCCTTSKVEYTDSDGEWGFENDNWCGIQRTCCGTTKRTTTTTRRTTTTTTRTTRKAKPTYSVVYTYEKKLNNGYENWGWDAKLKFVDSSMEITGDGSYGAVSLKKLSGFYGLGGTVRLDAKTEGSANVLVHASKELEEDEGVKARQIGKINSSSDFETYMFEIDPELFPYKIDRISIQDLSNDGTPIYVRFLIYSTGSEEDFVDPIDTSKVPVATTRKPSGRSVYTTIFKSVYSMPSGYDNWGWGCDISYSGGAMVITPQEGEYGAVSLKRVNGSFNGGSIRFDMKNEGKVNIIVENSDRDMKFNVDSISPSDTFETYILDIDFDLPFDRIDFQDAKGTGDRIWVKNLVHSTGSAEDFVDPI